MRWTSDDTAVAVLLAVLIIGATFKATEKAAFWLGILLLAIVWISVWDAKKGGTLPGVNGWDPKKGLFTN